MPAAGCWRTPPPSGSASPRATLCFRVTTRRPVQSICWAKLPMPLMPLHRWTGAFPLPPGSCWTSIIPPRISPPTSSTGSMDMIQMMQNWTRSNSASIESTSSSASTATRWKTSSLLASGREKSWNASSSRRSGPNSCKRKSTGFMCWRGIRPRR